MSQDYLGAAASAGAWVVGATVTIIGMVINAVTSNTSKKIFFTIGGGLKVAGTKAGHATLSKAGDVFPRVRDFIVVGCIQGFRVFRSQFNQNGANSVRSARNKLSPLNKISALGSLAVAVFAPVVGVMMLIGTYVVFYKDADNLPLTVLSTDAGVESLLGIGTAIVVNLLKLGGALDAAVKWVLGRLK